jgi:hypothetical protein
MAYFYGQTSAGLYTGCRTAKFITDNGGQIVGNSDGSVSVFRGHNGELIPYELNETCCKKLNENYTFDLDSQKCYSAITSNTNTCSINTPLKLVVNPKGNDGSLFFVDNNQKCSLDINFSYLFKIKCQDLLNTLTATNNSEYENNLKKQINGLNLKLNKLNTEKDVLTDDILVLNSELSKTPYSIACDKYPLDKVYTKTNVIVVPTTTTTSKTKNIQDYYKNYSKTGFGTQKWNSPLYWAGNNEDWLLEPTEVTQLTTKVNYCITEPNGLIKWSNILGNRYQAFLNGDPKSYTCDDVIALTYPYESDIFEDCKTPFGAKTKLLNSINQKGIELSNKETEINDTEIEIINLENNLNIETQTCNTPLEVLETLNVSMSLEVVESPNKIKSVYEENLINVGAGNFYNYLIKNKNTGFYVCGDPLVSEPKLVGCTTLDITGYNDKTIDNAFYCDSIIPSLYDSLLVESGLSKEELSKKLTETTFASPWLNYKKTITDPIIINAILNKKIKISLTVNNTCGKFCVLMDDISLNKTCTEVKENSIFISESPGFKLNRVIDNKKSWIDNTVFTNRKFSIGNNSSNDLIRQTNYNLNDERLVINSKEIDLNVNIASAIENDIWYYLKDNPCLLTATTVCTPEIGSITYPINTTDFTSDPYTLLDEYNNYGDIEDYWTDYRAIKDSYMSAYNSNTVQTWLDNNLIIEDIQYGRFFKFNASLKFVFLEKKYGCTDLYADNGSTLIKNKNNDMIDFIETFIYSFNNFIGLSNVDNTYIIDNNCNITPECDKCNCEPKTFQDDEIFEFQDGFTYDFMGGSTGGSSCCGDSKVDFSSLITTDLSKITTLEGFHNVMLSELIDVKNRKTIPSYPTLKAVYERYLYSENYCDNVSSKFTYKSMNELSELVGGYWVDIVEQVVPATTIWGSVKIYTNTVFDQQKFNYKTSSLFTCVSKLNNSEILIEEINRTNNCLGSIINKFYLSGCTV